MTGTEKHAPELPNMLLEIHILKADPAQQAYPLEYDAPGSCPVSQNARAGPGDSLQTNSH